MAKQQPLKLMSKSSNLFTPAISKVAHSKQVECEYCGERNNKGYGSGRFCSQQCARGFATKKNRQEINRKVSKTLRIACEEKRFTPVPPKRSREQQQKAIEANINLARERIKKWSLGEVKYSKINLRMKERVLKEQNNKCNICSIIPIWENKKLVFQINHIDGNNKNNLRKNIEILCPNCHSQTENWGYKKGKN